MTSPVFHLVCVRIGAGKTTYSGKSADVGMRTVPRRFADVRRRGMQLGGDRRRFLE
jgi:hypothetical protein